MSLRILTAGDDWELVRAVDSGMFQYALRGLAVTNEQAQALLHWRGRALGWSRLPVPGGWLVTLEVTQGEAEAICRGKDPLSVLALPLRARPLTHQELMSA